MHILNTNLIVKISLILSIVSLSKFRLSSRDLEIGFNIVILNFNLTCDTNIQTMIIYRIGTKA